MVLGGGTSDQIQDRRPPASCVRPPDGENGVENIRVCFGGLLPYSCGDQWLCCVVSVTKLGYLSSGLGAKFNLWKRGMKEKGDANKLSRVSEKRRTQTNSPNDGRPVVPVQI